MFNTSNTCQTNFFSICLGGLVAECQASYLKVPSLSHLKFPWILTHYIEKNSQIIKDDICLLFYLLFILWSAHIEEVDWTPYKGSNAVSVFSTEREVCKMIISLGDMNFFKKCNRKNWKCLYPFKGWEQGLFLVCFIFEACYSQFCV